MRKLVIIFQILKLSIMIKVNIEKNNKDFQILENQEIFNLKKNNLKDG